MATRPIINNLIYIIMNLNAFEELSYKEFVTMKALMDNCPNGCPALRIYVRETKYGRTPVCDISTTDGVKALCLPKYLAAKIDEKPEDYIIEDGVDLWVKAVSRETPNGIRYAPVFFVPSEEKDENVN